ncbi:MAG: hypothetical protein GHHEDOFH_01180 [Pseudorhodoplanes sp.]|nr:hypothetical protein [Pseudorhodoplanes sp.]
MAAVDLAGLTVELRQIGELLLARITFVDDADDAMRPQRPAIGSRIPASGILDPGLFGARRRAQAILDLVGNARALVLALAVHHRVETRLDIAGIEQVGIGAPVGDQRDVAQAEHLRRVRAPDQPVAVQPPFIKRIAEGLDDFRDVDAFHRRAVGRFGRSDHAGLRAIHKFALGTA